MTCGQTSSGLASRRARPALPGAVQFRKEVQPILQEFCYDCHGDGMNKGEVTFDQFKSDQAILENHDLWWKALKNLRTGMMPPEKKPRPSEDQIKRVERWIKTSVFEIDPRNPDPGRVTVRRLNRVEYRNTIRDLMGVDFNTEVEFPPDDTGHGFDNIGDVLTLSPMLLEKYLTAARTIVESVVPTVPKVVAEKAVSGRRFRSADSNASGETEEGPLSLPYTEAAAVSNTFRAEHSGRYRLAVDLTANERYVENQFDYNRCRLTFKVDGVELLKQEFSREGGKPFHYEFDRDWSAGEHQLAFELEPLTPDEKKIRSLTLRIVSVTMRGPMEETHWVRPKNHERFFAKAPPDTLAERREYARAILREFAGKAFRRPVNEETVGRLAALAEGVYSQPKKFFEAGIAHAMVAVLASPQFLFREEASEETAVAQPATSNQARSPRSGASGARPSSGAGRANSRGGLARGSVNRTTAPSKPYPFIDEHSLASRLSYFLWSSMPDEELFRLARERKLRENVAPQVKRMLADPRSEALMQNFVGQWLQTRDIETVQINARSVLARDDGAPAGGRGRGFGFGRPRADLDTELRKAMRLETERYFGHIVHEDRSVIELIDSGYAFLNERLSKHYGLTNLNVTGPELRRVTLAPDSPRGGVLTHGTVLAVTSNPTRTSPVKRGLFILENILGTPPPPPPPNIPALEDAKKEIKDREPTLRETLALHREQPLCSSCHNRMDPLGLALENFNAMGMWREKEINQPIDTAGKLITGESFTSIQEVKRILAASHRPDFYRTLTEKLLTYALGRGLEPCDVETVDQIVERLERADGKFSALLMGIIESAPFQKTRTELALAEANSAVPTSSKHSTGGSVRTNHENDHL